MTTRPLAARLANKFLVGDGCWEWIGARSDTGYGNVMVSTRPRKAALAHRAVYEWLVGPIPSGLQLDHLCRNRWCVRPDHLEPVTAAENARRVPDRDSRFSGATHCIHGHAFDEENTLYRPTPTGGGVGRTCRTCKLERQRVRRRREKESRNKET